MEKIQSEKMTGTSMDISAENRSRLKQLFPAVFTETKNDKGELVESIDFEKLKAELGTFSDLFESRRERYGMDWPGKKEALRLIQTPSAATLKPCREESVNFDTTENLYIEGDNLEVLKLLQKSYYGKVKMIYIDPPYNTGKEFIYPDNYTESLETYLEFAGLIDGDGKKFSTNTASEGRFHTKWLNMMYPRLYLARNMLRNDGVIFISIDDNEVNNLRKMCDEIFGEENFVGNISVINNLKGRNDSKNIATCHEYLLIYAKQNFISNGLPLTDEQRSAFDKLDTNGNKYQLRDLRKRGRPDRREDRPNMYFPIYFNEKTKKCSLIPDVNSIKILPLRGDDSDGRWRWGKDRVEANLSILEPKYSTVSGRWGVEHRVYLNPSLNPVVEDEEDNEYDDVERSSKSKSFWMGGELSTDVGRRQFKNLFETGIFDYPKSVDFINKMLYMGSVSDDIILDFFSGSATTAHSILDLNKQDGGNRKFIMVQLPEPCDENSEAFKAGYKTIAEIGKERIRRVIKKLNSEDAEKEDSKQGIIFDNEEGSVLQDRGFKVFKLDKSNFRQWQSLDPSTSPEQIIEQLELHKDHIGQKSTQEDLLYEILLKAGFTPTEKIETKTIAGKTVYSVAEGALLLCLEDAVTKELIDKIAEVEPMQFICLDSAFHGNDQLKANAVQTFAARNMEKEKHNQIIFKTV